MLPRSKKAVVPRERGQLFDIYTLPSLPPRPTPITAARKSSDAATFPCQLRTSDPAPPPPTQYPLRAVKNHHHHLYFRYFRSEIPSASLGIHLSLIVTPRLSPIEIRRKDDFLHPFPLQWSIHFVPSFGKQCLLDKWPTN